VTKEVSVDPPDQYNNELVGHVHPNDWQNPTPDGRYNLVVLGAGTAGLVTAAGAAGLGAKVEIVERYLMGGDCLNYGCVPSKGVISAAKAFARVRDAHEYGIDVPDRAHVNFGKVMERMRRLRAGISHHDSAARFTELGIDIYLGDGKFLDHQTIEVDGQHLTFKKAVIATGARAFEPPIPGLQEAGFYTNENIFSLTECPPRIVVVGGGPIGCELAQTFQRLGSQVTQIEMASEILPREDQDAAAIVRGAMEHDGVHFVCDAKVKRVETIDTEKNVIVERDGKEETVETDAILIGAGRVPNIDGLNLDAVGVKHDQRAGVKVDDTLCTANPNILACGDVCQLYKFTHTADAAARIVIQNTLFPFFPKGKLSKLVVPWCTYTDPEIAHVGLSAHEAAQKGIPIDTYTVPMNTVDRAILDGEENGLLKVHVAKGKDTILGATMVSAHAGESISEITLAITQGIGLGKISDVIHPYPTQAEAIKKAGDAFKRTKLTPAVAKIFRWLIGLQR
jgi:pyruvate/2-oxoglutarate dehydrogenase complex dihydrolipoamide dehydrogenase (E3) component